MSWPRAYRSLLVGVGTRLLSAPDALVRHRTGQISHPSGTRDDQIRGHITQRIQNEVALHDPRVRQAQGFFTLERTCPGCQGRGQMIEDPCPSCTGSGRVTRERDLSVNIPQGVEDGTRIRLAGEGEAGVRGGPAGDLYIFLSLATHQFFQRDGADLHCRVPISMVTASLGGEFEVPTIDKGKSKVKIPAGTQSGRRFRIASKGMPVLRSRQTGDMYVQVVVETPQNLTKKQQELLAEFEKLSSGATQPEAAGFFAKVKDFFGTRVST